MRKIVSMREIVVLFLSYLSALFPIISKYLYILSFLNIILKKSSDSFARNQIHPRQPRKTAIDPSERSAQAKELCLSPPARPQQSLHRNHGRHQRQQSPGPYASRQGHRQRLRHGQEKQVEQELDYLEASWQVFFSFRTFFGFVTVKMALRI